MITPRTASLRRRTPRRLLATTAAALTLTGLAACGSDGDSPFASDDTIKVMVYGPFEAKGFSLPGYRTGAQAGVEKVNEDGGINGRDLELVVCNDNNDPNTAQACARQAASEGVVAIVGGVTTFEAQVLPSLEKAGIPVIGTMPVADFTSPVLYPFLGGGAGALLGLGKAMAENPVCEGKVGVIQEQFDATDGTTQLFQAGIQLAGGTPTTVGKAPQNATDFAPAAAAAAADSSCAGIIGAPQTTPQMLTAAAQNGGFELLGSVDSMVANAAVEALGSTIDGFVTINNFLPLNDTTDAPAVQEFLERGRAIDPDFDPDQGAASAYLAPQVLAEALKGVDEVTPATIVAALEKLSGYDTGMGPIIDFTTPNPTTSFSRLPLESPMYEWVARDGQYVLGSETTIDISGLYETAAKAGQ